VDARHVRPFDSWLTHVENGLKMLRDTLA